MKLDDKEATIRGNKSAAAPAVKTLDIGADFYSLSLCTFIKHFRTKFNITPE